MGRKREAGMGPCRMTVLEEANRKGRGFHK